MATFAYDGFGNVRGVTGAGTNAPAAVGGDFRFHGAWLESATDLYHMRAREYDQRMGRFLSRDPNSGDTRVPETLHSYSFANNNASYYSDPSGEFTTIEFNIVGAIQKGLNTAKAAAVNRGRSFAIDKIHNALVDLATKPIQNLLPANLGFPLQGLEFERQVRESICKALGNPDGYFYFDVAINENGTPRSAGVHCESIQDGGHSLDQSKSRKGIRKSKGRQAFADMVIGPDAPRCYALF